MIRMGRQMAKRWGKVAHIEMGNLKRDKLKSIKSYVAKKESKN